MAYALHIPRFPRRSPLLGFIVLMHAVVIYYINDGLQISFPKLPESLTLVDIAPDTTRIERVKAAKPDELASKVEEIDVPLPPPVEIAEAPVVTAEPEALTDSGDSVAIPDTSAGMDPRHPIGKPPYPAQAIRLEQEGRVVVNACVQPNGRLTDVRLAGSSGFELLDTAAVKHLARPGVRMRPGTLDGRAVTQCLNVPIRFSLRDL